MDDDESMQIALVPMENFSALETSNKWIFAAWEVRVDDVLKPVHVLLYAEEPGFFVQLNDKTLIFGAFPTINVTVEFLSRKVFNTILPLEMQAPEEKVDFIIPAPNALFRVKYWQGRLQLFQRNPSIMQWVSVRDVTYEEIRYLPDPLPRDRAFKYKQQIFPN